MEERKRQMADPFRIFISEPTYLVGAYWSGERWYPMGWNQDGYVIDQENPTSLDIANGLQEQIRSTGSKITS